VLRAALWLPPGVAWFYARAYRLARKHRDEFSVIAAALPEDVSRLLALAKGRRYVVELGTGTAWTAIALALADPRRQLVTYDPVPHPQRAWYLELASAAARARIEIRSQPAEWGPADGDPPVELLFIDISAHTRSDTVNAFRTWRRALAPDAVVAFHDYGPAFPGVVEAIEELGLHGTVSGHSLFVWRADAQRARAPSAVPDEA
jgi:predicted O-methyltransferase YrrM